MRRAVLAAMVAGLSACKGAPAECEFLVHMCSSFAETDPVAAECVAFADEKDADHESCALKVDECWRTCGQSPVDTSDTR